MGAAEKSKSADNSNQSKLDNIKDIEQKIAPSSAELVIGLVGYAGSGCTAIASSLYIALQEAEYEPHVVKVSKIIETHSAPGTVPTVRNEVPHKGCDTLERATALQDAGDKLREGRPNRLAALVIDEIRRLRGSRKIGESKIAYIVDSLKNVAEVELLREVYGPSFRLMAVHCDRSRRLDRLCGGLDTDAKFAGAKKESVEDFIDRDEKDSKHIFGQQVRDVFHLADYFVDDNVSEKISIRNNYDLKRFFEIVLGAGLHRPTTKETAMYNAFSAALRASCLSRQVGAALISATGELISIGSNDVPKFGGGTYLEGSRPDNRCAYWEWSDNNGLKFVGCHNSRHKASIEEEIEKSISNEIKPKLAAHLVAKGKLNQGDAEDIVDSFFRDSSSNFRVPRVRDLIEFSRSIHAEMDALLSALRQGKSPVGGTLFCTTFPCHNCARHLVAAGINVVYYVEPYVKSLAIELHSDAIQTSVSDDEQEPSKMAVIPFTGVGPRMYEDHFLKRGELKRDGGIFVPPSGVTPISGARLGALEEIEKQAANLAKP